MDTGAATTPCHTLSYSNHWRTPEPTSMLRTVAGDMAHVTQASGHLHNVPSHTWRNVSLEKLNDFPNVTHLGKYQLASKVSGPRHTPVFLTKSLCFPRVPLSTSLPQTDGNTMSRDPNIYISHAVFSLQLLHIVSKLLGLKIGYIWRSKHSLK